MAMVYRLWLYGLQVWIGATCMGGAKARVRAGYGPGPGPGSTVTGQG